MVPAMLGVVQSLQKISEALAHLLLWQMYTLLFRLDKKADSLHAKWSGCEVHLEVADCLHVLKSSISCSTLGRNMKCMLCIVTLTHYDSGRKLFTCVVRCC